MGNRLKHARSPYLLAHADDPVDWYPFGEEAFQKARAEDKPLFLSVGYHACHWCHVMHRESFQDPEVAELLNRHFVPVKVDREERPDVDAAYMRALVSLTGQGGWPMSLFLTPEGKPFFGGTYFPKEDRGGLPGFRRILLAVAEAWRAEREGLEREAERLAQALWRSLTPPPGPVPEDAEERALEALWRGFDPEWGGFLPAPKFPQGPLLLYLLALAWRGEGRAREMLRRTLRGMALGGIYDQVGGGFHRYAVDRFWRVPHFEKMLYDNALLARVYLGAYKVFREDLFLRVARETLDWLLSLQHREGGFYSALGAESEGEEGRYYTWTEEELAEVLGEHFPLARHLFALGEDLEGRSVLTAWGEKEVREKLGEAFPAWRKEVRQRLGRARWQRMPPDLDDKVLADWSALAVRALAEAGRLLGEVRYLEAARKGVHFLVRTMKRGGLLRHAWREGRLGEEAFLADQAFASLALLELYAATGEWPYLEEARRRVEAARKGVHFLVRTMKRGGLLRHAWREGRLGEEAFLADQAFASLALLELYAATGEWPYLEEARRLAEAAWAELRGRGGAGGLPLPAREVEEGALPSGESALAEAFWRLQAAFGGNYRERAQVLLEEKALWLARYPQALPGQLWVHRLLLEGSELAVPTPSLVLEELRGLYLPLTQLVSGPAGALAGLEGREPGKIYLCREGACRLPVESVEGVLGEVQALYSSDVSM